MVLICQNCRVFLDSWWRWRWWIKRGCINKKTVPISKINVSCFVKFTEAQSKFLEAFGEKEAAIAALMYVDALKEAIGIGKDDLEKGFNQTKKSQQVIKKRF